MLIRKSFHFIRHGETNSNVKGICSGGKMDVPLNPKGIEQAGSLRKHLKDKKFGAIFASPLKRAIDTAFLATGQIPILSADLREWEAGDFEEKPVAAFLKHIRDLPAHIPLPKGRVSRGFF